MANEQPGVCPVRAWQCSGCHGVFFGPYKRRCQCGMEEYWTRSVYPQDLAAAMGRRPHSPTCDALTAAIAARDDAWRAALEQARAAAVEECRERVVAWLLWAGRDEEAAILAADEWYVGPRALDRARALIKEVRRG